MALTLRELAQIQVNNQKNPYVGQTPSLEGPPYDAPPPEATPPAEEPNPLPQQNAAPVEPVSTPSVIRTGQSPGLLAVPETKIVGKVEGKVEGKATGPSKPAEPSAERKELGTYEEQGGQVLKALDAQESSIQQQMDILKSGQETADKMRQTNELEQQLKQLEIDRTQRHMKQDADERDRQLEQQYQDVRNQKVDPNHWFKKNGTAGNILAAIAIGAGAFAAAMPHTTNHENQALGIINDAVNRDVDAQRGEIEQKWKDLNWKGDKNDKAYVRDQFTLNKMNEAKLQTLSHANALIDERLRSTNNSSAIAGMQGLKTQVQLERSKVIDDMAQHRLQVALKERAQAAAAAGANPYSNQNMMKEYNIYYKKTTEDGKPAMPYDEWAKGKQGAGAAGKGNIPASEADKIAVGDQTAANIAKLRGLLAGPMTADTVGQYGTLYAQTVAMVAKDTTGRFNEQEAQYLRSALPDPNGVVAMIRNGLPGVGTKDLASLKALQDSIEAETARRKNVAPNTTEDVPGATPGIKR